MANEKRLIDANKLKWKLGQVILYVKGLRFGKTVLSKILESYRRAVFEEIDEAPTVDAVEVVRCKNCVSFNELSRTVGEETGKVYCFGYCYHWDYESGMSSNQVDGEDFCSYGERKDVLNEM